MHVIIKKWGNSAGVRLPAAILASINVRLEETVDVREENGRIIIEPVKSSEYDLDQLLDAITPENLYAEVSFGPPVGKEIF